MYTFIISTPGDWQCELFVSFGVGRPSSLTFFYILIISSKLQQNGTKHCRNNLLEGKIQIIKI
jgi:hypothetical protein